MCPAWVAEASRLPYCSPTLATVVSCDASDATTRRARGTCNFFGRVVHAPILAARCMYRFWPRATCTDFGRAVHVPILAARYMYRFWRARARGTCTDFNRGVYVPFSFVLAARYMYRFWPRGACSEKNQKMVRTKNGRFRYIGPWSGLGR